MTKKIIALCLALVMVFGVAGCGKYVETKVEVPAENTPAKDPVYETQTFTESDPDVLQLEVENDKVFNKNWNGVNAVDQGFMFLPDEYGRNYTDEQIEEELKRMDEMDINMVRSYMDAGYAFQKREGKTVTYDWDSERMKAFLTLWKNAIFRLQLIWVGLSAQLLMLPHRTVLVIKFLGMKAVSLISIPK